MSSFRRTPPTATSTSAGGTSLQPVLVNQGSKPWFNNLGIVSTGHRELDEYIGGGIALGTLFNVENDIHTNYGETILSYNIAEGLSHGHNIMILSTKSIEKIDGLLSRLPYNESIGTIIRDNEAENSGSNDLKIAWQYAKYIDAGKDKEKTVDKNNLSKLPRYCCSYNLSKGIQDTLLKSDYITRIQLIGSNYENILGTIKDFINKSSSEGKISRIFFPDISDLLYDGNSVVNRLTLSSNVNRLLKFILQIKYLIRGTRSIVVTSTNYIPNSSLYSICLDSNTSIESFAGHSHEIPAEFNDYCGFFVIKKLQQVGVLAPFRPPGSRFGLKRDKRKLYIQPLHLPPEESRAFSSAGFDSVPITNSARNGSIDTISTSNNIGIHNHDTSHEHSHHHNHDRDDSNNNTNRMKPEAPISSDNSGRQPSNPPIRIPSFTPVSISRKPPLRPGQGCSSNLGSSKSLDF